MDKELMEALKKEYKHKYPDAMSHRVEAAVFRLTYNHKLR